MAFLGIEPAFDVTFGAQRAELVLQDSRAALQLPMPWLAGPATESLEIQPTACRWEGDFLLAEAPDLLVGATLVDAGGRLEDAVEAAYTRLLDLAKGWHLYRIWQYVPQINEVRGGLERYRQFNIGRWAAFERRFGRDLRSFMPAASAVGLGGDKIVVIFKAGRVRPNYFENPSQVPAYHYPAEYGPRPPGFARGVVADCDGSRTVLLSGTASIEGHRSVGEGDWELQFRTTMHNIEIMLGRMGCLGGLRPESWAAGGVRDAHFKCYLRYPEILPLVREWLQDACGTDDHFTYLLADICRTDLDLEIEGRIVGEPCCSE
ncbi:MAG: hypothetical protein H7A55_01485 [Verrucomicrobiaceae bacterium]|nr:hypothetical protein [Verrucomicrobiaceae bacterium]